MTSGRLGKASFKSNLRCSCNHQVDLQGLSIAGRSLLQLSSPRTARAHAPTSRAARRDENTAGLARSSLSPLSEPGKSMSLRERSGCQASSPIRARGGRFARGLPLRGAASARERWEGGPVWPWVWIGSTVQLGNVLPGSSK